MTYRQARPKILAMVGTLMLGLLASCSDRDDAMRYRLTVVVDTPSGTRSGSSIVESDFRNNGLTTGQAPIVDLGNGRYLFALLTDPFSQRTLYRIMLQALRYPESKPPLENPQGHTFRQAKRSKPKVTLRRADYPMLVTFRDIGNAKSVLEVDPDNLVANFGPGYKLERIAIEVVDQDEPITEGLEGLLKWLGPHALSRLSAGDPDTMQSVTEAPLSRQLSKLSFVYRSRK